MYSASVVIAVKDREAALANCLYCWRKQDYPAEYIIVDDNSSDAEAIKRIVDEFQFPDVKVIRITSEGDRTPAIAWNNGFQHTTKEFVFFTGGDLILSGNNVISEMLEQYDGRRISLVSYFLSKLQTDMLSTIDWKENPQSIETIIGFWTDGLRFQNNQQIKDGWGAGLTMHLAGQTKEAWEWFGLFRNMPGHLFSDQDVYLRELQLGKLAKTATGVWAYHQWHPIPSVQTSAGYKYSTDEEARLLSPALRG